MILVKNLPTKEAEPSPEVLISVGKSSAPYRKITPKENVMHIFPEKNFLLKIKPFENLLNKGTRAHQRALWQGQGLVGLPAPRKWRAVRFHRGALTWKINSVKFSFVSWFLSHVPIVFKVVQMSTRTRNMEFCALRTARWLRPSHNLGSREVLYCTISCFSIKTLFFFFSKIHLKLQSSNRHYPPPDRRCSSWVRSRQTSSQRTDSIALS